MDEILFEWDEAKSKINAQKHGVTFQEARTVFQDDYALVIPDTEHSQDEDRFIILGLSVLANMLVVCHCCRGEDDVIRIISARKATTAETRQYMNRRGDSS